jgi:hypothetical protein
MHHLSGSGTYFCFFGSFFFKSKSYSALTLSSSSYLSWITDAPWAPFTTYLETMEAKRLAKSLPCFKSSSIYLEECRMGAVEAEAKDI